ncbi:hypothetical protein HYD60_02040 [Mycoplasmopsis bovis]|nr:hypothetical protein HYD60_02040 [Mycoplasmopsis bovis]
MEWLWKKSASTSGGDFISYYLSRVKQKRIDHISLIFEIIFRTFALILITVIRLYGISADKPI